MDFGKQLKEGLITQNPVLVQLLGMCSTLAITTTVSNGIGMGLSVTAILICSNVVISLLRKVIPSQVRIAAYIVVIAGFVTIVDLLLQAFAQDIAESLGVFIPLIVVNCIILARAESFASKNKILPAAPLPGHRLHAGAGGHERYPGAGGHRGHRGDAVLPRRVQRDDADTAGGRLPHPGLPHRPDAVGPEQGR